jgi:hypothetical protein
MKLHSIHLPMLPILGQLGNVVCDKPPNAMIGWSVRVRGAAVFLVSPPGWEPGLAAAHRKADGPRRTYGPIKDAICQWEGEDAVDQLVKYDSEAMGAKAAPVLSDEELERATAPKAAARR